MLSTTRALSSGRCRVMLMVTSFVSSIFMGSALESVGVMLRVGQWADYG